MGEGNKCRRLIIMCVCLFLSAYANASELAAKYNTKALRDVIAATVSVVVEYGEAKDNLVSNGTGFIVEDGYVLTNAHVVNHKAISNIYIASHSLPRTKAEIVKAQLSVKPTERLENLLHSSARFVLTRIYMDGLDVEISDPHGTHDLALLKFTPPDGLTLPKLEIAAETHVSEPIIMVGYPSTVVGQATSFKSSYGIPHADTPVNITHGFITSILDGNPKTFFHSASTAKGNSGGPIVDENGVVVGIQTWFAAGTGFDSVLSRAQSAEAITRFIQNARETEDSAEPVPDAGKTVAGSSEQDVLSLYETGRGNRAECALLIGLFYYLGEAGFPGDKEKGIYWLEKALADAMEDGSEGVGRVASGCLGLIYIHEDTFHNPVRGIKLLRDSNGSHCLNPDDMRNSYWELLAHEAALSYQGEAFGIAYDPHRSFELAKTSLSLAEDNGHAAAIVGFHHYFGDVVNKDHAEAMRLAHISAYDGSAMGISLLAHLYYDSTVIDFANSTEQEREYYDRLSYKLAVEAMQKGDVWAAGLLAKMYLGGTGAVEKDLALADALASDAFFAGNRLGALCRAWFAWDAADLSGPVNDALVDAWAYFSIARDRNSWAWLPASRKQDGSNITDVLHMLDCLDDESNGKEIMLYGRMRETELIRETMLSGIREIQFDPEWQRLEK